MDASDKVVVSEVSGSDRCILFGRLIILLIPLNRRYVYHWLKRIAKGIVHLTEVFCLLKAVEVHAFVLEMIDKHIWWLLKL